MGPVEVCSIIKERGIFQYIACNGELDGNVDTCNNAQCAAVSRLQDCHQ
jgi:hypothetical protein